MLAGYLPKHQRSICQALGLQEFAQMSGKQLAAQAARLEDAVEARLKTKTTEEWDAVFTDLGIVAGGVRDLVSVHATGQPEARELFTEQQNETGTLRVTNNGYRVNNKVFRPNGPPPRLGQHTRAILTELGVEDQTISELYAQSIIH